MATATGNHVHDNSSLANFKDWAQAISSAIGTTCGWTQTTDTGQVNWGTIGAVPSSTYVYEVWKASDALAATCPIFVKIEYGFSSTVVRVRMTVGTGSDGAGNITGQIINGGTALQLTNNETNNGATTFPCYFSGTTGEFRMAMWSVTASTPTITLLFVIERSKDSAGNNTADYFSVIAVCAASSSSTNNIQQSVKPTGVGPKEVGIVPLCLTNGVGSGSAFGTVAAFPIFPIIGQVGNPMIGVMSAFSADVANTSTCTVASMYASTHTFIGVNPGSTNWPAAVGERGSNAQPIALLMRYE